MTTERDMLAPIFDTLPSGMVLFEPGGRILRINQQARHLLDWPVDTPCDHLDAWQGPLQPLAHLLRSSSEDVHRGEFELHPSADSASWRTLGYSLKHLHTPDTHESVRAFIFTDITQVLRDRLAMDKIKDELNQSKKLASIGTMIAGVAHELNNPLTGMSMSTSLLRMNLERLTQRPELQAHPDLIAELQKGLSELQKISRANEKASVLVNDLLAYSKPTQLYLVPLSLDQLIRDVIQALKSHPQFSRFQFQVDTPEQPLTILADRVKLEQVFYNLFKNACDATDNQGSAHIRYTQRMEHDQPWITAHVRDNGPGIDPTVINRIFDPFFTTKGHSGVGLGLSISYRTVEQHGGQLSVHSVKWEGTEFNVSLPLHVFEETPADTRTT